MAAGGEMLPYPTQTTAAASSNYGVVASEALPLASEGFSVEKKTTSAPAEGAGQKNEGFTQQLRHGLPVLGLCVASAAVTGMAAGGAATPPATGLGLFLLLIIGLSTVTIRVLRA